MHAFGMFGLASLAVVSLAGCGQPSGGGNAAAAASPAAPSGAVQAGLISPDQAPHLRPGLWVLTVGMADAPATGPGTQMCVDEASEARLNAFGQHAPGAQCSAPQFTRNADGAISFTGDCKLRHGGASHTSGTITGDFNSGYTEQIHDTITGSPMATNGDHTMTIVAKWTGPCPAGQRGGDVTLPNGQTHNILDAQPATAPG